MSAFRTNPFSLGDLMKDCDNGVLQLPDFQRSWVWDEDRIKSLVASVSRGFPVGALMTLDRGGEVEFKPRPVEGAPSSAAAREPSSLLLDGQQRMTSLYQVTLRGKVVETVTARRQRVRRWFYFDVLKALDPAENREDAIVGVPEDKILRSNFGRDVELDLSSRRLEIENLMYPLSALFSWDEWLNSFIQVHMGRVEFQESYSLITRFKADVLDNLLSYQVPVIALESTTSKEAVCTVFEKVNTGGKPLDAFELITAMYAADGHELRKDWYGSPDHSGRAARFKAAYKLPSSDQGILAGVGNTDFLQVVALFATARRREELSATGVTGKDLPQVSATRQTLLNLPLSDYRQYENLAEEGFLAAGKFLLNSGIYRVYDLPYQTQVTALAAVLGALGNRIEQPQVAEKVRRWYWSGVFGELYGSTTETRIARDFVEVLAWTDGGTEPGTVQDAIFRSERLRTMRMRLSAAYKGVNALLMLKGAQDFRTGQSYSLTVFADENVDIHHIFPQDWCKRAGIPSRVYDSVINKTPLSARTNRIIGGVAPSAYLGKLESEMGPGGASSYERLAQILRSHLIDPEALAADDFEAFMSRRQEELLTLIEEAMGRPVYREQGVQSSDDSEVQDVDEP